MNEKRKGGAEPGEGQDGKGGVLKPECLKLSVFAKILCSSAICPQRVIWTFVLKFLADQFRDIGRITEHRIKHEEVDPPLTLSFYSNDRERVS